MKLFLFRYRLEIVGVLLGTIAGWSYWHFIGCTSGTCPITSDPFNSMAYGALMGGLLLSTLKK